MEHDFRNAMRLAYPKHELTRILQLKSLHRTQNNVTSGDLEYIPRDYTDTSSIIRFYVSEYPTFRRHFTKSELGAN